MIKPGKGEALEKEKNDCGREAGGGRRSGVSSASGNSSRGGVAPSHQGAGGAGGDGDACQQREYDGSFVLNGGKWGPPSWFLSDMDGMPRSIEHAGVYPSHIPFR